MPNRVSTCAKQRTDQGERFESDAVASMFGLPHEERGSRIATMVIVTFAVLLVAALCSYG